MSIRQLFKAIFNFFSNAFQVTGPGSGYYWMAEGRTNGEAYCRVVELRGVRTEYLVSANMKYLNTRPEIHHHLTANIH